MKFLKILIISILFSFSGIAKTSENTVVPFTLSDRGRIMRTEQKLEAFQKNVYDKFNGIDGKFEGIDDKICFTTK